ncbi:MAG: hypothetical protein H6712_07115 [Myxococcales bacterium]|nr:hypothetical protein [Myxococcales bacterium]MCB9713604.1 hypothetical protein [Myxococcales bacterium]
MTRLRARPTLRFLASAAVLVALACEPERPPAPKIEATDPDAPPAADAEAFLEPGASDAILTYAGDRGVFADTSKVDAVPPEARGLVRVKLLSGPEAPAGTVWVTNLGAAEADGRFRLRTVPRDLFEELALGEGRSSDVSLPEGLRPPEQVAKVEGVIVYKTAWCGVCKKLEGYLKRKGVDYEAKDIEKDRAAAAELQAKAQAQGVRTGSVPVIDVGGQLIVGFDRARLEQLL